MRNSLASRRSGKVQFILIDVKTRVEEALKIVKVVDRMAVYVVGFLKQHVVRTRKDGSELLNILAMKTSNQNYFSMFFSCYRKVLVLI